MNEFVSLSEAGTRLPELLACAEADPVYLLQKDRPVGVLVSPGIFESLLGRMEELEDLICVSRHSNGRYSTEERIPWEKVKVELDLD